MQREKLYNPHNKAYLNYVISVFKESETLCDKFSRVRNHHFFLHECKISFFLFHFFIT